MSDSKVPEVVEALASGAGGALGATANLTALSGAGVGIAPALVGALTGLALHAYQKSLEQKAKRWFELVAALMELGSADEASKVIADNIEQPWAHKSVVEGVRAILNDIDDVALRALAIIVARGLRTHYPPDWRDKQAIQMLGQVDKESYDALVACIQLLQESGQGGRIRLKVTPSESGEMISLGGTVIPSGKSPPNGWRRAFSLLKRYGLGADGSAGQWGSSSGPNTLDIDSSDVSYLAEILTEGSAAIERPQGP